MPDLRSALPLLLLFLVGCLSPTQEKAIAIVKVQPNDIFTVNGPVGVSNDDLFRAARAEWIAESPRMSPSGEIRVAVLARARVISPWQFGVARWDVVFATNGRVFFTGTVVYYSQKWDTAADARGRMRAVLHEAWGAKPPKGAPRND